MFFWAFFKSFHSSLKFCIFTKLSQIVYLINAHIVVYSHAKCDCRLWKVFWFNCDIGNFYIYYYMFETLKLHQTFVIIYGYVSLAMCYIYINYLLEFNRDSQASFLKKCIKYLWRKAFNPLSLSFLFWFRFDKLNFWSLCFARRYMLVWYTHT